ncbi:MAG: ABC transporter permease subunit [Planctomycetes bacterium]|nr:ABC transporter permease subunit [Planctomycetota bacterium]
MNQPAVPPGPAPVPPGPGRDDARFTTPRATLLMDRFMTGFIKVGGGVVIVAVLGIMVFIASQSVALFSSASVRPLATMPAVVGEAVAVALDEWGERPAVLGRDGSLAFLDPAGAPAATVKAVDGTVRCVRLDPLRNALIIGLADRIEVVDLEYEATVAADGRRTVVPSHRTVMRCDLPGPPQAVSFAQADTRALAAAVVSVGGRTTVHAQLLVRQRSLGGEGELKPAGSWDLGARLNGEPVEVLVDEAAESAVVATASGQVAWFHFGEAGPELRQSFQPFDDRPAGPARAIVSMAWIFGDVSLSVASPDGANRILSLHRKDGGEVRLFGRTKDMPQLPGVATFQTNSVRNKAYLVACGKDLSLRYATTAAERWRAAAAAPVVAAAFSAKYHRIAVLGADRQVRLSLLDDPHPEAGWGAFFGRIWYEGAPGPDWTWQSSGANDDFEPKLSMVPLIWGTLKATFYALLFAMPIALLAAVYTAEFMHPRFKVMIKPAVEIMASLPSVVLGFLAALWLAPILEPRVPSVLCVAVLLPLAAIIIGWGWSRLTPAARSLVRPGYEFLFLVPLLVALGALAWHLGPVVESLCFTVPVLGQDGRPLLGADGAPLMVGDFARWWPAASGMSYEGRNSLVVGFMMGFAVIPIIFTIAEDSLSNVPNALRSGSLALGASRWQTAMRVVVPTASAGIFSAVMIGLGRAIGETMIVVMATGNTAIMDPNIFNGMRTLSANIAVELPEAPQHSTLYRTLFLGALLLFLLTFAINTVAEIMRARLRDKYKTV